MRFGSFGGLLLAAAVAAAPTASAQAPRAPVDPSSPRPGRPVDGQARNPAIEAVSEAYSYRTYCASCHGVDGKGEGPLAQNLRFRPPDLTLLAMRNGGQYPTEKVRRIVDGRNPLQGHGGPEMPIWGDAFKNADTGYDDQKARERIRSIVDYLRTLQLN
jgi:mono/diheme cytochrome c family protein